MSVHSFSTQETDLSDFSPPIGSSPFSQFPSPTPSNIEHAPGAFVDPRLCAVFTSPDITDVTGDETFGEISTSKHLSEKKPANNRIPLCSLDSFLPIFRIFGTSLVLSDNAYHLHGGFNRKERERAWEYARSVGEFTLTDNSSGPKSEHPIASGTMMRLLQLQSQDNPEPFFPSLNRLRIIDAKSSLPQLWSFFLTPSLKSLEVAGISDTEASALLAFLNSLVHVTPRLEAITFSPGSIPMNCTKFCVKFLHLRELRFLHPVAIVDFSFLKQIGQLPNLMTLSINTKMPSWYEPSMRHTDKALQQPGFRKLETLHVVAILEVLQDLIGHLAFEDLKDISLTLLTSSEGPPPPEPLLPPPPPINSKQKKQPRSAKVEKKRSTPQNEDAAFAHLVDDILWKWNATLTSICIYQRQETDGLLSIPLRPHSLSTETVQRLLSHESLERLDIDGWNLDFKLEEFIKQGYAHKVPRLQGLFLPLHATSGMSSLNMLRLVFEAFPNLVSFQCNTGDVSDVPDYSDALVPKEGPYPRFEELFVGNSPIISWCPTPDLHHPIRTAQYLDILFPNLKAIKTREGGLDATWEHIDRLVKMCQISRSHHVAQTTYMT